MTEKEKTVTIKYVGNKPKATDNVAGTNIVWKKGESQKVPEYAAAILLKYPDVWQQAITGRGGANKIKPRKEAERYTLESELDKNLDNFKTNTEGMVLTDLQKLVGLEEAGLNRQEYLDVLESRISDRS